jgi:hypothetical protein
LVLKTVSVLKEAMGMVAEETKIMVEDLVAVGAVCLAVEGQEPQLLNLIRLPELVGL